MIVIDSNNNDKLFSDLEKLYDLIKTDNSKLLNLSMNLSIISSKLDNHALRLIAKELRTIAEEYNIKNKNANTMVQSIITKIIDKSI